MSKSAHPLDSINITTACAADWDLMIGNDVVRFCQHCNLNVHDLSLMTRQEALALVRNSNGRLCLRYTRRPDGTIQTAPPYQKLHTIKRRASRIVAGAFGATLSLSAAVAAAQMPVRASDEAAYEAPFQTDSPFLNVEGGSATLVGVVQDQQKAVVPGAKMMLINEETKVEMSTLTNDEGQYRFQFLTGGSYTLVAEAPGFMRQEIRNVKVSYADEESLNVVLEVGEILSGMVVVVEPSEPLIAAVLRDDLAAIKELLATGSNVNAVDKNYDTTALAEAAARGNQAITQILLRAGADSNIKNSRGQTALMYLGERSTDEVVRALIAAGARVDERDAEGNTVLLTAAVQNNAGVVRTLLEAGANVDERNRAGQTALMLAAREGHIENVQALLDVGANVHLRDGDGWTALKYARRNSHTDIAELLKSYGALE